MRGQFRKVKDKLSKKRKDSVIDSLRTNSGDSECSAQPSFLGLPAEIRNDIYQRLAASTTLILSPSSPRKRPAPVGLLVACRQTRQEYRAILWTNASLVLTVHNYNFGSIIRTFEKLKDDELSLMRMNTELWIYLHLAHVPSRDDRKALRAWCDYRNDPVGRSYFGTGQRVPREIEFHYDVRFLNHMRPPRPPIRYSNGFEMKGDLVRSHSRMAARLESPDEESPSLELKKIREDLDDCSRILEEKSAMVNGRNITPDA